MRTREHTKTSDEMIMEQLRENPLGSLFSDLDQEPGAPVLKGPDDPKIIDELSRRRNSNTKDFHLLKFREHIPIFVYGTLRAGNRLHYYLQDCPCLGEGLTVATEYSMYTYQRGGYPVILPNEQEGRAVYGEVYVVDPMKMLELDAVEGNGLMYFREEKFVWCLDQDVKEGSSLRPAVKAWVYIGNPYYWETVPDLVKRQPVDFVGEHCLKKYPKVLDWLKFPHVLSTEINRNLPSVICH